MPGEIVSCVGCHERQGTAPPARNALALNRPPSDIHPWRGPVRGFSFPREVQPVLDKYCVACHDGQPGADGRLLADLRGDQGAFVVYEHGQPQGKKIRGISKSELLGKYSAVFEPAYVELRPYVRVGGLESDLHLLPPGEFHADTSELIQMLKKGHYQVKLDPEAWDRLVTWIDLNAPCHGTWGEVTRIPGSQQPERRRLLRQLYGGLDENDEEIPPAQHPPIQPIRPESLPATPRPPVKIAGWPFDAQQARQRQAAAGPIARTVNLGGGVTLDLVRIPAGTFVMGDLEGEGDELPLTPVTINKPFWMAKYEITNQQYRRFKAQHDSRFEDRSSWIFSEEYLGWTLNRDRQPAVRISFLEAQSFCRWLSQQIGESVTLPTEAQWEYACRAGTDTPWSYGGIDMDFSPFANLADSTLKNLALEGWRPRSPDLVPRDSRFDDHALVTADVGQYQPNAWGLCNLHGNAAEWTRTTYRPYPYRVEAEELHGSADASSAVNRSDATAGDPAAELKVVRGGSWRDRPQRGRSAFRLSYPAWQKVFNVSFRIVVE